MAGRAAAGQALGDVLGRRADVPLGLEDLRRTVRMRVVDDIIGMLNTVGDGRTRPLLTEDTEGRLVALSEQRRPFYVEVAKLHVDTASRTPGQVASLIAARLHEWRVHS